MQVRIEYEADNRTQPRSELGKQLRQPREPRAPEERRAGETHDPREDDHVVEVAVVLGDQRCKDDVCPSASRQNGRDRRWVLTASDGWPAQRRETDKAEQEARASAVLGRVGRESADAGGHQLKKGMSRMLMTSRLRKGGRDRTAMKAPLVKP